MKTLYSLVGNNRPMGINRPDTDMIFPAVVLRSVFCPDQFSVAGRKHSGGEWWLSKKARCNSREIGQGTRVGDVRENAHDIRARRGRNLKHASLHTTNPRLPSLSLLLLSSLLKKSPPSPCRRETVAYRPCFLPVHCFSLISAFQLS